MKKIYRLTNSQSLQCSGGQHFLPWDKISSLFFTVQPFSEHLNWTNILEVLAIINCNSKFQNFTGFSIKSNCFDEKKMDNVSSLKIRVNIRFFSRLKFFQDMIFFSETQIKWSYKNGHKSNTRLLKALKKYLGNFYFIIIRFGDSNKQLNRVTPWW